jgi:hypothetical protein
MKRSATYPNLPSLGQRLAEDADRQHTPQGIHGRLSTKLGGKAMMSQTNSRNEQSHLQGQRGHSNDLTHRLDGPYS